jgi:hypothetical protein
MGDPGTGPTNVLMVGFGPDENGKDIVFSAIEHKYPNECCVNALGDLIIYEQNKDPAGTKQLEWMINPNAVPPFVFHKQGEITTPISEEAVRRISEEAVRRDLVAALTAVGAPPYVECINEGCLSRALEDGCSRHELESRVLAPTKSAVSSEMLWLLNASNFGFAVEVLAKVRCSVLGGNNRVLVMTGPLPALNASKTETFKSLLVKPCGS